MFPLIRHIDDVLPHIKDKPEIIVVDKGDYTVLNYVISTENTFDNIYARECRGIKFDKNGNIIARPFHKWFNIGQTAETQPNVIAHKFDEPHTIMPKLDGSMIHPVMINEQIRLCTKMGITDTSLQAEEFIFGKRDYQNLMATTVKWGFTPCFEWTSNKNRIVLDYPQDDLVLLAIRDMHTGAYSSHQTLVDIGVIFDIPVVKRYNAFSSIHELMKVAKALEGEEGFVVQFPDGDMVKAKSDWYCLRHHSRDLITQEYRVVQMILNEEIDDLIPMLLEDDIKKVHELEKFVEQRIEQTNLNIIDLYLYVEKKFNSKKTFALSEFSKTLTSEQKSAMFSLMDGHKTGRELAIETIRRATSKDSDWKEYKERFMN